MIRLSDFENALATLEELRVKVRAAPGQMRDEAFHQVRDILIAAQQHCIPARSPTVAPRQDAPDAQTFTELKQQAFESLRAREVLAPLFAEFESRGCPMMLEYIVQESVGFAWDRLRASVPSEPRYGKTYHDGAWTCGCGGPDGICSKVLAVCDECEFLSPYLAPHAPEPVATLVADDIRLARDHAAHNGVHHDCALRDSLMAARLNELLPRLLTPPRATPPQRAGVTEEQVGEVAKYLRTHGDVRVYTDFHARAILDAASRVAPQGGET